MFTIIRTAVRFFFIGFGVGLLLAPRAGAETRQLLRDKLDEFVGSVLEVADLPPVEPAQAGTLANASSARGRPRAAQGSESGAGTAKG